MADIHTPSLIWGKPLLADSKIVSFSLAMYSNLALLLHFCAFQSLSHSYVIRGFLAPLNCCLSLLLHDQLFLEAHTTNVCIPAAKG